MHDNSTSVSTDTIKNVVNIVARENTGLCTEEFCQVLAQKYLDTYPQIASVAITAHETKWSRLSFGGKPHPHSFVLDSNGKPTVDVTAARGGASTLVSGIDGFTFMKSTQSGWENYVKDPYTTIPPTADRMCATSMVASWKWSAKPQNYPATNAKILDTVLEVFGTTYSMSVQDSLYRMGEAALAAVPEISEISMACPNMHFHPDESVGVRARQQQRRVPADRRAARPDRMHGGAGVGLRSHTVIASAAKQSILPRKERMDCLVATLLAMTVVRYGPSTPRTSPAAPATAGPA